MILANLVFSNSTEPNACPDANAKQVGSASDVLRKAQEIPFQELVAEEQSHITWSCIPCPHCSHESHPVYLQPLSKEVYQRNIVTVENGKVVDVSLDLERCRCKCPECNRKSSHVVSSWLFLEKTVYSLIFILCLLMDKDSGMSNDDLRQKYGVSLGTIYNWLDKYKEQEESWEKMLRVLSNTTLERSHAAGDNTTSSACDATEATQNQENVTEDKPLKDQNESDLQSKEKEQPENGGVREVVTQYNPLCDTNETRKSRRGRKPRKLGQVFNKTVALLMDHPVFIPYIFHELNDRFMMSRRKTIILVA